MMCLPLIGCLILVAGFLSTTTAVAQSDSLAPKLATLKAVDREAAGHRAAAQAWGQLTASADGKKLPEILSAIDGASPLAANWLRSAVDAVAARELERNGTLPIAGLETFLDDKQHDPRARRLAYEWIVRADSKAPDRLVPRFLDDPSLELRRDAVARVLTAAEADVTAKKTDAALEDYRQALVAARDLDQVKVASDALKKLGQPVDLAHHFGFLQDWKLIGPFDNHGGKGFDVAYPPESSLDQAASYDGTAGTAHWIAEHTDDEYGFVDLNKALNKHMGAVGYAMAEFQSQDQRPAEIRVGTQNANKIWLNGKLLCWAEVYHANGTMDQYVGRGELKSGRNVILLKVCQNEQKEDWAQDWKFQLRVCDATGRAILAADRPTPRVAKSGTAQSTEE